MNQVVANILAILGVPSTVGGIDAVTRLVVVDQVTRLVKLTWNHTDQSDERRKCGHYGYMASVIMQVVRGAYGEDEVMPLSQLGKIADALATGWEAECERHRIERETRLAAMRAKYMARQAG